MHTAYQIKEKYPRYAKYYQSSTKLTEKEKTQTWRELNEQTLPQRKQNDSQQVQEKKLSPSIGGLQIKTVRRFYLIPMGMVYMTKIRNI